MAQKNLRSVLIVVTAQGRQMAEVRMTNPGWFPDPSRAHQFRFFSTIWTDQVSDGGVVTTAALGPPPIPSVPTAYPAPPAPPSAPWPRADAGYAVHSPAGPATVGPPAAPRAKTGAPVLVLVGGILMSAGTLFPWESVSTQSAFVTTSGDVKGTAEGAGPVVLAAGLIIAVLAVLVLAGTIGKRRTGIATLLVSAASLVFAFGNFAGISNDVDSAPDGVTANIGIGLILAIIGAIMALVASIGLVRSARATLATA